MDIFKLTISTLFIVLLFSSCEKEFIVTSPEKESIAISGIINNQEPITAIITKSFSAFGETEIQELKDADVSIFSNGKLLEQLTYMDESENKPGKFYSSIVPEPDQSYQIRVSHNTLGEANATATIPTTVSVSNTEAIKIPWTIDGLPEDSLNGIKCSFSFTLNDPTDKNNYYLRMYLNVYDNNDGEFGDYYGYMPIEIATEDLIDATEYISNGYIFSDEAFNGEAYTISGEARTFKIAHELIVQFDPDLPAKPRKDLIVDVSQIRTHLEVLSLDAYGYYSSHAQFLATFSDDFAEPIIFHTNVESGIGIFAGANLVTSNILIIE